MSDSNYKFWLEVTEPKSGETVRCEWANLTLLAAKQMHKTTEKNYSVYANYLAPLERFGWEEMK
jgi:hypothetical protein